MEAPKCRLCGNRHYGICRPLKLEPEAKPKFDRVKYQREYMRKRRAKLKAEKTNKTHS